MSNEQVILTVTFGPNKQMTKLECSSAQKMEIEQADNGGPESCYRISISIRPDKEEPIAPIEVNPNIEEATIERKQDYDSDNSWTNPILEHVRQPKDFL